MVTITLSCTDAERPEAEAFLRRFKIYLKATPAAPDLLKVRAAGDATSRGPGGAKIRCPHCHWQPKRKDLWGCTCGHTWNTFDTHGLCPGCGRQWMMTACLSCNIWSAHEAWYAKDEEDA